MNEENWTAILLYVRHEWHSYGQFTFNFYCHWATLVVRNSKDGSGHFLQSKEGMTQGGPLVNTAYAMGVLLLIRELQDSHPRVTQPYISDDAKVGSKFVRIVTHFHDLQAMDPPQRFFPEATKSILVISLRNVARVEDFFRGMGIKVFTGTCYLGVFIGDREDENIWMEEKVQGLEESVKTLSGVARNHPQFAYAGLHKSLQQEWAFVQQVTPKVGDAFSPLEEALSYAFILDLF